ncbi:hypothetical protein [Micromonospora sp. NPDC047134]|uniref:hypothetical protein n=1 Tax=Micromonospora sp. NPDC047134 TaxID=3154340 RepID=UPI0033EF5C3D
MSISTYLLLLFAVCQLISAIITLATIGDVRNAMEDALRDSGGEGLEGIADLTVAVGVGTALLTLALALAVAGLGLVNLRGKNGSRIATWIVGGILFCCNGFSLLSGLGGGLTTPADTSGDMPSPEELQRRIEEALPSWVTPVTVLLGVISLISLLAALILLALPKANEFFRKPTPQWEPPTPGATYPGTPGYPGYPPAPGGYPGQPGAHPGQPGGYPGQPGGYPGQSGEPGYPPPPGQSGEPGYPPPPGQSGEPGYPPPPGQPGQSSGEPGYPPIPGQPSSGQPGDQGGPNPPGSQPPGGNPS